MSRLGVAYSQAFDFIKTVKGLGHLIIEGLYTHFPVADTNPAFTLDQVRQLAALISFLAQEQIFIPYVHAANSMGLAAYPSDVLNLGRPGLMLYGLYPIFQLKEKISLQPAMSVKAKVLFIKKVSQGQGVSYGHTFVAPREMTVATLSIGYSNGYLRSLSNKSAAIIQGSRCPQVGRVTMDQIMVDASNCPAIKVGAIATILGKDGTQTITAEELARLAGTINYEITCALGNQLPRMYK